MKLEDVPSWLAHALYLMIPVVSCSEGALDNIICELHIATGGMPLAANTNDGHCWQATSFVARSVPEYFPLAHSVQICHHITKVRCLVECAQSALHSILARRQE